MKKWNLTLALLCAWLATPAMANGLAEGDASAGEAKAAVCAACHGADGKAIQPAYPNLAGQHAAYLAKQLTDYRDGNRVNALMSGQAANLSDQDILDLAAYYAAMPKIENVATEENLTLGMDIYRGGITSAGVAACSACHGPDGMGNPTAAWPVVSGQNAQYTADQLRYFRSGERANDANAMMRGVSKRMTDEEIDAVANYIAGLHASE
ncbi:MAG: cytochrome c [Granulosicoccus sp.]